MEYGWDLCIYVSSKVVFAANAARASADDGRTQQQPHATAVQV